MSDAVDLFLELAALPSPPGEERAVADVVLRYLRELGLEPDEDDCGPRIGSTTGTSTRARADSARGRRSSSAPISTRCRRPGTLEPVVEDGVVRNAGGTILGCRQQGGGRRDARGRAPRARREPAARRDRARVHAEGGGRPDRRVRVRRTTGCTRRPATCTTRRRRSARSSSARRGRRRWTCSFHGRAAHAGMFPEEGRSAIQAAAKAIADLRLGRVDEETTANVGVITGGTAGNIVPEWCTFRAEARCTTSASSAELVQEMLDAFTFAATETRVRGRDDDCARATAATGSKRDEPAVRLAARRSSAAASSRATGSRAAAADANVFNERGRRCVNLANGMTGHPHARRADRGRRPRRDGRRDARTRRGGARRMSL